MVIGSLYPISVEGVIRGLRWGIGPKGAEAFSSHHIWMFIPSVGQHGGGGGTDGYMYGWMDGGTYVRTYGINIHMWGDERASAPLAPWPMPKKRSILKNMYQLQHAVISKRFKLKS
jgi:hypothetical protein